VVHDPPKGGPPPGAEKRGPEQKTEPVAAWRMDGFRNPIRHYRCRGDQTVLMCWTQAAAAPRSFRLVRVGWSVLCRISAAASRFLESAHGKGAARVEDVCPLTLLVARHGFSGLPICANWSTRVTVRCSFWQAFWWRWKEFENGQRQDHDWAPSANPWSCPTRKSFKNTALPRVWPCYRRAAWCPEHDPGL